MNAAGTVAAPADTLAYVDLLYGTADRGYLPVWTPGTGDPAGASETTWVPVTDHDRIAATVAALTAAGRDAYHGVGLHPAPLGRSRRGTSEGVIALPGVWMDVDVAGPAHAQAALPPTEDDALDLIGTFPLEPSLVVHSGHGLYPWWLFPEVFYVETGAERGALASSLRRVQRAIIREANGRGWYPEFTGDLARVLRVVGSDNLKPGLPLKRVAVLYTSGRRYTRDDFEGFLPDEEEPPRASANGRERGERERADLGAIVAGCGFMAHWRDDAATLSEPEWHAGITVAAQCRDGERLVHEHSAPHPGYDAAQTQKKFDYARRADKPMRCATIRHERGGEPYCAACPHWGAIKGPIALGRPRLARPEVNGHGPAASAAAPVADGASPDRLTEAGNAEDFARRYGDRLRFDHKRARWLLRRDAEHRWVTDPDGEVERLALEAARARYREAQAIADLDQRTKAATWAIKSESRARLGATVDLARSVRPIADAGDAWDADPWLLGCPNGVVDLRTGQLRPGRVEDRITMTTGAPYDPEADAPRWLRFLDEVFGARDLVDYVHRVVGYCLTGDVRAQQWWLLYGRGSNGKSVFLRVLARILGDYFADVPFATFARGQGERDTYALAQLEGRRLVIASESGDTARLNTERIKAITGGDPITARRPYQDYATFSPLCKLMLTANHRPVVTDGTFAFWRRVRLIPFDRTFEGEAADETLDEALAAETPGVLRWAVRGCAGWRGRGLDAPPVVLSATRDYQTESDPLAAWIGERCVADPDAKHWASELYQDYLAWCEGQRIGERERLTNNAFGRKLGERLKKSMSKGRVAWWGLRLGGVGDVEDSDPVSTSSRVPHARSEVVRTDPESSTSPTQRRVCVHCGVGLPPGWAGRYCEQHGGPECAGEAS